MVLTTGYAPVSVQPRLLNKALRTVATAPDMRLLRLLLCALLVVAANAFAAQWKPAGEPEHQDINPELSYAKRRAVRLSDGRQVSAHLAFFTSRAFRLEVVDLGDGPEPAHPTLADAFRAAGCVAGINGGFFHPDGRPSGLVIAAGRRINRLETAKLLSGLIYSDGRGIHLIRRARFQDHAGIGALLQSGPYLVEEGRAVRGLSASDSDRRSFVATDWRGHWVLGATQSPLTLAELAQCLASPGVLTPWQVDRALNLDGGSSTGFFFERGEGRPAVALQPWKRVRNLLGIVPH
ncbi:MAG: phosphodiester glycosidase family protein [Chromatiaceae bacterium]